MNQIKRSNLKLYRHYKNMPYKYIGEVRHSESLDELVLYEARYPNELASLWVRPRDIFFEDVEINEKIQPRFQQVEFRVEATEQLSDQNRDEVTQLLCQSFGDYNREQLNEKLRDQEKVLLLAAHDDQKFVGFKLGYQLNEKTFYSWLGAIDSDYQGIGLGTELMNLQHRWCKENGYEIIATKTMNKWKSMLFLNLQSGFQITGTEKNETGEIKILMEKSLESK